MYREVHEQREGGQCEKGEFVTIVGPSGAGKSTLLSVVGLLDGFDDGSYRLEGREISGLSLKELARIRLTRFGFVFQSFYLISYLTALENVEMPLGYTGLPASERRARATEALSRLSLVFLGSATACWKKPSSRCRASRLTASSSRFISTYSATMEVFMQLSRLPTKHTPISTRLTLPKERSSRDHIGRAANACV